MSTAIRDKIIGFLGAGVSPSLAADAAGVTPAYVSQLLMEEGVREAVAARRAGRVEEDIKQDATLENAEKRALEKMLTLLPLSVNLGEVTRSFQVLNGAKRKAQAVQEAGQAGMSVTIVLPKAAEILLQVNAQNQVIDINGQSIAPLPSRELPKLAAALRAPQDVLVKAAEGQPQSPPGMHRLSVPAQQQLVGVSVPAHVQEVLQRGEEQDKKKALSIFDDITTVINGVQVVI